MNNKSPFALSRFEYGRTHLYYLPPDIFPRIEHDKPLYLVGSRGTGKTTLLTALTWREQTKNKNLQKNLDKCGKRGYVGVYVRMPDSMASNIDIVLSAHEELLRATTFAYYLDLLWLEELTAIMAEILASDPLAPTISIENEVVREVIDAYTCLSQQPGSANCRTMKGLVALFHSARRALEHSLAAMSDISTLLSQLPSGQVGEFGRHIAASYGNLFHGATQKGNALYFKVCFDEAECLSAFQQRTINTMVRLSRFPLFFVISYVRPMEEMTRTLMPQITLQNADRDLIFGRDDGRVLSNLLRRCRFRSDRTSAEPTACVFCNPQPVGFSRYQPPSARDD